jgi:hypothetical protein
MAKIKKRRCFFINDKFLMINDKCLMINGLMGLFVGANHDLPFL